MAKLLLHCDSNESTVLVLATSEVPEELRDCGRDMDDWPDDLGIFERQGLWVWEGNIIVTESDFLFEGKLRSLTRDEWAKLQANEPLWEAE